MPQAGPLRRQAEREFYYRQLGGNFPLKRVDQLAREYYGKYLTGKATIQPGTPLEQLELVWLKQWILDHGGTLPNTPNPHPVGFRSALWRQALITAGLGALATKNLNDNRYTFYLNN